MEHRRKYHQSFAEDVQLFEQFIEDWDVKKDIDFDENKEVYFISVK
jgi:hypothetical protein